MYQTQLHSIPETAHSLGVSEALVERFIKKGLVTPVEDVTAPKLTEYGIRRLNRILELYENSYSFDTIEKALNH